ncbi:MAG: hypothetical protein AB1439_06860 [candidate division FCPU426 bacterium]
MKFTFLKRRAVAADRLLAMRAEAGDDPYKHAQYHKAVNRYQKIILKAYNAKKRVPFRLWFKKMMFSQ